jgi:ABC-type Zn uptake system ZnuABC Zn-binding protein ZnuA
MTVLLTALFTSASFAQRITLVTTTAELASLASEVGGDLISVSYIIPAGQDGENFQPRPQDLARIREAEAIVRVGVDYDLWLDPLLRQSGNVRVQRGAPGYIDASTDVALLDVRAGGIGGGDGHAHGRGNPHYWFDPANAETITATLLESLARLDPPRAQQYETNRLAFLARLDAKMREWTEALRNAPPLIAYHDTWPYFARRFRLRFVGVIETRPGIAPSPSHLASLVKLGAGEHVGIVVREPHEPRRDADFLASRMGARVAVLASGVGAVPQARDYLSLIDYNVRALK